MKSCSSLCKGVLASNKQARDLCLIFIPSVSSMYSFLSLCLTLIGVLIKRLKQLRGKKFNSCAHCKSVAANPLQFFIVLVNQ